MSRINLSNEAVIAAANAQLREIQRKTLCVEMEAEDKIRARYEAYTPWFKRKPQLRTTHEMAEYLFFSDFNDFGGVGGFNQCYGVRPFSLSCDKWKEEETACLKLKCMAQRNEADFMWLDREEVEVLGIC